MKTRLLFILGFMIFLSFIYFTNAAVYQGDGIYKVQAGDNITLSNGWTAEVVSIFMGPGPSSVNFIYFDNKGVQYSTPNAPSSFNGVGGYTKFGNSTTYLIDLKLLNVSGSTSPTDSPNVVKYQYATIEAKSIDEIIPSLASGSSVGLTDISKELNWNIGKNITLNRGSNLTLANGYKLKFVSSGAAPGVNGPAIVLYILWETL